MGWIYLPSVTVQNGSNIVTVSASATDSIKPGDGLLIGAYDLVEIIEVSIGQLKLKKNWSSASQSNAEAAVVPTFGDFNAATAALRQATTITQGNFAEMEKWWTETGQVTFKAYNNTEHTVRTAKQMEQDISALEDQANVLIAEVAGAGYARSESDMITDRARNNQLFAASGHIHAGKHRNDVNPVYGRPIQDGLWTYLNNSNVLRLGAYKDLSNVEGDSKTYESVFNFSGVTAHLKGLNTAYENAQLTLPLAPKGTEVYDSATGVLTNFETDVDPKYGDVAADSNEAVARAFGLVRLDDSGLNEVRVASGATTYDYTTQTSTSSGSGSGAVFYNIPLSRNKLTARLASTKTVTIEIRDGTTGTESSPIMHTISLNANEETVLDLNLGSRTKAQIYFRLVSSSEYPVSIQYSEVSITNEVVTSPVDLVGFEVFLRPINASDPFIYPYGMQQSKLTSIDGIPTVENNVRPITHFAVYTGDTTSRGYGWNLFDGSLSDAQKAKIFQNPEHNIYRMSDGTIVQWTVSQRTIRGLKNGDWLNVNPISSSTLARDNIASAVVTARGSSDLPVNARYFDAVKNTNNVLKNNGVFTARNASDIAYNGECYFYVIATVPRLNQGAYHPSLNPFGTKMCNTIGVSSSGSYWYDSNSLVPLTTGECFKQIDAASDSTTRGAAINTGAIASSYSGYPSNLRFDAIYASGQGGVIDQRLKYGAWDASSAEQAAVVREEVKNGTYRGRESLKFTKYVAANKTITRNGSSAGYVYVFDGSIDSIPQWFSSGLAIGGWLYTLDSENGNVIRKDAITGIYQSGTDTTKWAVVISDGSYASTTTMGSDVYYHVAFEEDTKLTVEGNFSQTDVLGDPANILQVAALKYGWVGSWIPIIPDSDTTLVPMSRKYLTAINRIYKGVVSASWSSSSGFGASSSATLNDGYAGPNEIMLFNYTAFAKQTEPSANLSVFNGERGLSSVFASSNYRTANGCLLSESLLGNVLKSDSNLPRDKSYPLTGFSISSSGTLEPSGNMTSHSQIDLSAPTSGNKAFKALYCQFSSDQQANLNIIANELIYSSTGGNWGDDAKLKIVADGTFTDLNGNKCKAVIHKLAKPYGFIKL